MREEDLQWLKTTSTPGTLICRERVKGYHQPEPTWQGRRSRHMHPDSWPFPVIFFCILCSVILLIWFQMLKAFLNPSISPFPGAYQLCALQFYLVITLFTCRKLRSHTLLKLVSLQLPNTSPGCRSFFWLTALYWRFPQPSGIQSFAGIASRTCKQFITKLYIYVKAYNSFIAKWKRCIW